MGMRLKSISMKSFFGFEQFDVDFKPLTVLVGPNNGGKTTIIRAVRFAVDSLSLVMAMFSQVYPNRRQATEQIVHKHTARRDALINQQRQELEALTARPARAPIGSKEKELAAQAVAHAKILADTDKNMAEELSKLGPAFSVPTRELARRLSLEDVSYIAYKRDELRSPQIDMQMTGDVGEYLVTVRVSPGTPKLRKEIVELSIGIDREDILTLDDEDKVHRAVRELTDWDCFLTEPVGSLQPKEDALPWPNFVEKASNGRPNDIWRNQMHWLNDGKSPEMFKRVMDQISEYIPGVTVAPPGRTKDQPPRVSVEYGEDGVAYDAAVCGTGARMLLSIASAIELSDSSLLLFDEPDTHLHSGVQRGVAAYLSSRAEDGRQIIVATHAPDMIEAFPLESIQWIERGRRRPMGCDSTAKVLVDLGALTHRGAMESIDRNGVLFFEASQDREILGSVFRACGSADLLSRCRLAELKGCGDAKYLPGVARLLKTIAHEAVPVAAILDSDYIKTNPEATCEEKDGVVIAQLPCKEIENLILLQPVSIAKAVKVRAESRARYKHSEKASPTEGELSAMIDEITATHEIEECVKYNWLAAKYKESGSPDGGAVRDADHAFHALWEDATWRRRCAPGKQVLARLRQRLQDDYKLSFGSLKPFFEAYNPPPDIRQLVEKIDKHLQPPSKKDQGQKNATTDAL